MELLFSCLIIIIMSVILLKNVAIDLFARNEITTSEQGPKKVKLAKNQKLFVKPFSLLRQEKLQFFA